MTSSRISAGGKVGAPDISEFGEIQTIPDVPLIPKLRSDLRKEEEAVSLIPSLLAPRETAMLDRALGLRLTYENPVWRGDSLLRLRSLQKRLVSHSLELAEDDRTDCLRALSLVERAVRLRLRWVQMQRSAMEGEVLTTQGETGNARQE